MLVQKLWVIFNFVLVGYKVLVFEPIPLIYRRGCFFSFGMIINKSSIVLSFKIPDFCIDR